MSLYELEERVRLFEGCERAMLQGDVKMRQGAHDLRLAICGYHRKTDTAAIPDMLIRLGFESSLSLGCMLTKDHDDGRFGLNRSVCHVEK